MCADAFRMWAVTCACWSVLFALHPVAFVGWLPSENEDLGLVWQDEVAIPPSVIVLFPTVIQYFQIHGKVNSTGKHLFRIANSSCTRRASWPWHESSWNANQSIIRVPREQPIRLFLCSTRCVHEVLFPSHAHLLLHFLCIVAGV